MDIVKNFLEEIVDEIKKEDKQIQEFKSYLLNSILYNKYFIGLYVINVSCFILLLIIIIVLLFKDFKKN
jgi:hypothetical protein